MRITVFVLASVAIAAAALVGIAQEPNQDAPRPPAEEEKDAPVSTESMRFELMVERRETLQQVVELLNAQHRLGQAVYEDVLDAEVTLAEADLELAPNRGARQIVHERRIKHLRQRERLIEGLIDAGRATQADYLNVKAARLQAEIDMLGDRR